MNASLRLLGGLRLESAEVTLAGRAIQKKRLAFVALLGTTPGRRLSRDKLVAYLWPESDSERARHQLASSVYELRKALGDDAVLSVADEIALNPERLRIDVADFDAALRDRDWELAVQLYQGPFLDGFFLADAAEFERWVENERSRLAQAFGQALEELATTKEQSGERLAAVELWRKLAAHDLFNSRVALRLMRALEAAGDRAGALQHARTHTTLLREELGIEPDADFSAVMDGLRVEAAPAANTKPRSNPLPRVPPQTGTDQKPAEPVVGPESMTTPSLQRRPRSRRAALLFAVVAIIAVVAYAAPDGRWQRLLHAIPGQPIVVMMDSPHPRRVYDEEVAAANGTNADIINDILRDLPVQRVKETAGPLWHRDEEIRSLNPDLIVIHLSAFCNEQCEPQRIRMRRFIEYLADTKTKFLIYSRFPADTLTTLYHEMIGDLPRSFPQLEQRITRFSVVEYGTPHWKDPATAAAFKLRVKEILSVSAQKR